MSRRPVHSEVRLDMPPSSTVLAGQRFRRDPGLWLPPPATPMTGGHRVELSMATRVPTPQVMAIVAIGIARCPAPWLLVRSITWRAETADDLFPVLRGDLELHTSSPPTLRLVGSYSPPLSVLGALTDQVVGRHLATEVVRGFLVAVAERLTDRRRAAVDAGDVSSWGSDRGARTPGSDPPSRPGKTS